MVLVVKNPHARVRNVRDLSSIPGLGRSPGGGYGNPLHYSCLENLHGQRSLAGYSPEGHKESDMTKATEHAIISCLLSLLIWGAILPTIALSMKESGLWKLSCDYHFN